MKQIGRVEVPQEAFVAALKLERVARRASDGGSRGARGLLAEDVALHLARAAADRQRPRVQVAVDHTPGRRRRTGRGRRSMPCGAGQRRRPAPSRAGRARRRAPCAPTPPGPARARGPSPRRCAAGSTAAPPTRCRARASFWRSSGSRRTAVRAHDVEQRRRRSARDPTARPRPRATRARCRASPSRAASRRARRRRRSPAGMRTSSRNTSLNIGGAVHLH